METTIESGAAYIFIENHFKYTIISVENIFRLGFVVNLYNY